MSNVESWKTWEGRVIEGRFPLRQWLGGSDHSAVFLTEQPETSVKAAIKLVAADAEDADRLLARWRASAHLAHPHLSRIFDGGRGQAENTPVLYVVTELADEDLSQILPQRALTPTEVSDMLSPLLDVLSYLHGRGLVHSRIKPSNVMVVEDRLKLSADEIRSSSEVNLGEFAASHPGRRDVFDAPETAAGIVTPAGDLWSVGATIVAALMQKLPVAGEESQLDPGLLETLPQPFRGIARECLHLDPARRCSIQDIRARLEPPGRSVPAEAARVQVKEAKPAATAAPRFHFGWRMLIPVAVLLVFGFGLRFFYKGAASNEKSEKSASAPAPASQPAPFTQDAPKPADTKGSVTRQVMPDVPASARNTITGTIKVGVRVEVDASGKVASARLVSSGPSRYFSKLAVNAAEKWGFSAPVVNGRSVESTWAITFRFRRSGTQASVERARR